MRRCADCFIYTQTHTNMGSKGIDLGELLRRTLGARTMSWPEEKVCKEKKKSVGRSRRRMSLKTTAEFRPALRFFFFRFFSQIMVFDV